jgi:hypothetical protein
MKLKKFLVGVAVPLVLISLTDMNCSSGGDPKPVDCTTSDLDIVVSIFSDVTICSASDGSITVIASGGKEPYSYKLNSGTFQSSATFSSLSPGSHTVTVKDKNGCEANVVKSLTAPGAPIATLAITDNTNCLSPFNGEISITNTTGGTGPYTYKLQGGAFGAGTTFDGLQQGTYTITIKDNIGCEVTQQATVDQGATGISYNGDIKAIFTARCNFAGCHPDNGDWFTYSVAKGKAATIKSFTANGTMPKDPQPGGAR